MKKVLLIIAVVMTVLGAEAQTNYGRNGDMQTIFGQDRSFGGFIGFNSRLTELNKQDALMVGGELSMVFGHSLNIGVAGYGLVTDVTAVNLSEENQNLFYEMGYGGLLIEPVFMSKRAVHFTVPLLFGAGGIGESKIRYFDVDQIDDPDFGDPTFLNNDVFLVFEPGLNLELNLLRFVRIYGGVSYRIIGDVDLPNTDVERLGGFSGNVGLRFGWF